MDNFEKSQLYETLCYILAKDPMDIREFSDNKDTIDLEECPYCQVFVIVIETKEKGLFCSNCSMVSLP